MILRPFIEGKLKANVVVLTLADEPFQPLNFFLFGEKFTAADAYLFVVTNWANFVQIDLSPYPNLKAYQPRVAARPKVQEALKAEGLLT